jgi:hypothetical protein
MALVTKALARDAPSYEPSAGSAGGALSRDCPGRSDQSGEKISVEFMSIPTPEYGSISRTPFAIRVQSGHFDASSRPRLCEIGMNIDCP